MLLVANGLELASIIVVLVLGSTQLVVGLAVEMLISGNGVPVPCVFHTLLFFSGGSLRRYTA